MDNARKILAIETSGRHGSVAALWGRTDGGTQSLTQIAISESQRTAQALAPALERLLREANWRPADVQLVAVAVGPGSFTGLRIGVTAAKTFAYAVSADVIAVNTLDALAAQAPSDDGPLWTILDAQRQELFAAKYRGRASGAGQLGREIHIIGQDAWLTGLQPGDRVTGTALNRLAHRLPAHVDVIASARWQPMAEAIGSVGWHNYQAGQRDDLWWLTPHYYRASAAEEKNPA